ncbi:MAG: DNA-3-methyladenine glycosylase 2 family protein [Gemmatimonadetes bacterium]|nr:DNA-3-methyladenine glycosylase 2 family protein [Gemmatimonadota bacterium]
MHRAALRHLRTVDPILAGVIQAVGPCRLEVSAGLTHFEAVARSIVYQQLSGKAAATIYGRFAARFPGNVVEAGALMRMSDDALREVGLSRQKAAYLRDLATRVVDGALPIETLHTLDDAAVIGHLTTVKGVGLWTAQMFLLFRLGRPDILPDLDLGVQKAMKIAYRMRKLPTPERVRKVGARWAPWRSVATWYLWRSIDGDAN